jgi:hypothetical protein
MGQRHHPQLMPPLAGSAGLLAGEAVGATVLMRSLPAHAGDLSLFFGAENGKSALGTRRGSDQRFGGCQHLIEGSCPEAARLAGRGASRRGG